MINKEVIVYFLEKYTHFNYYVVLEICDITEDEYEYLFWVTFLDKSYREPCHISKKRYNEIYKLIRNKKLKTL
ncbi:hypothetical protein M0Q50_09655 [bacterium]|nr:hypothetical protein [bacterium]